MIIGNDSRRIDAASLAAPPLVNHGGLSANTGCGSFHVAAASSATPTATSGEAATAPTRRPSPAPPSLALHGHGGSSWLKSPSHMAARSFCRCTSAH